MSTQGSPVDPKTGRLLDLTAAAVLGDWEWLVELRKQAPAGEPDRAWRETLLQCHLFGGYPRVVEAFETLNRHGGMGAVPLRNRKPLATSHEAASCSRPSTRTWRPMWNRGWTAFTLTLLAGSASTPTAGSSRDPVWSHAYGSCAPWWP